MSSTQSYSSFAFCKNFLKRFLPNEQAVVLAIILVVSSLLVYWLSDLLMPVIFSVILAYLLEGLVQKLEKHRVPRLISVYTVFSGFMAVLGYVLFVLTPMVTEQAIQLVQNIPQIIKRAQMEVMRLPELYPQLVTEDRIREVMFKVQQELLNYGQELISSSAESVMGLVSAIVYLFLVPLMVFFFLKDKEILLSWVLRFLPRDRHLTVKVWREVDEQIGNYVRGKFLEVFILWFASYVTFSSLSLNYAMLLAVFMGLSVIIPYVGATLVTFPVLIVAAVQFGVSSDPFMYVVIAYGVIQAIDGVILVPLLFSEAVNLHPVAIIVAILFFGGLWGFWGVFFAIPLATLVKAVINAWPRLEETEMLSEM